MLASKALAAAVSQEPVYVEDVFSTYLIKPAADFTTYSINNGIDLLGEGGMTWFKARDAAQNNLVYDTVRGSSSGNANALITNGTQAQQTTFFDFVTPNANGFTVNFASGGGQLTNSGINYASWTFRKQAKFFDVVTYTGDGSASPRQIAHSLGSVPGFIVIKRTDTTSDWTVWHRSVTGNAFLQTNDAWQAGYTRITTPDSTTFTVGASTAVNANGGTYVAYLFAHNAGGFGLSGTDNVISCGSFTMDGSGNPASVTLGYEPQMVIVKRTDSTSNWYIEDNMRGIPVTGNGAQSYANTSGAEAAQNIAYPNATGFTWNIGIPSATYIYIAIRRGPMKVPTSGTSVFAPVVSNAADGTQLTAGFPVDMQMFRYREGSVNTFAVDRLRGVGTTTTTVSTPQLRTNLTDAETNTNGIATNWNNTGFAMPSGFGTVNDVFWNFRRAPGFFDIVCYTGTGSARTVDHNLAAVPELMIVKSRAGTGRDWVVYAASQGNNFFCSLNDGAFQGSSSTMWNDTTPTSSVFTVGTNLRTNNSGQTYVAYLFATVAGVSKVGSYTGSGTTKQIDCGFTAGARFVLIKRTDSTGDWYVYDSARGIVAGNDPYLLLNSTAAEVTSTDYVDTYSAGFELSSTAPAGLNASGGTYIFLAIA